MADLLLLSQAQMRRNVRHSPPPPHGVAPEDTRRSTAPSAQLMEYGLRSRSRRATIARTRRSYK